MSLGRHVMLGAIGQGADGHAFISITRSDRDVPDTHDDFLALTRDGRTLECQNLSVSGFPSLLIETFEFPATLAEIKAFHQQTQPVRSVEFKNVPLAPMGTLAGRPLRLPCPPMARLSSTSLPRIHPERLTHSDAEDGEDIAPRSHIRGH